ncbi:protein max [Lingula anatina]|uniref:Protein max n=1 Tax=Lingula anatina TaxID=7574 RepID=A0A1S3HN96_LINAN|nr:protein max [Lingula anatina]|eukprot:XP_013386986.1 protein max [Lingula anatina]
MSDDERDIDIESDEEEDEMGLDGNQSNVTQFMSQAEKRAHHNALERKRRDHIKESFHSLRDSIPSLQGEKVARSQILKKASEYIQFMRRKNNTHHQDLEDLKRQNSVLDQQVRALEKAKTTGTFASQSSSGLESETVLNSNERRGSGSESSESDLGPGKRKKLKTST